MSRRALTLLLASLLTLGLTLTAAVATVPYVALGPGPTYDTLGEVDGTPVLEIEGREVFPTDGQLDLTTVGVQPSLTLAQALQGWFARDLAVVPREVVFPPGRTDEEVDEENAAAMQASQSDAVAAAARELGLESEIVVAELNDDSPAQGRLEVGDVLTAVDGTAVADADALRARISEREPGDPVQIGFERDGRAASVEVVTGTATADGETRPVIGVLPEERYPLDVTINLEDVGGPSAGLMFTLGILDKLGEESLTGGEFVAGTGEIDPDGTVGPIGGITQKLIAAGRKGAVAFLVPAANCAEAVRNPPDGLVLASVGSLDDALTALQAVRDGGSPVTCAA
ncbi:PDZ domain-containing protein [soil metagenome]